VPLFVRWPAGGLGAPRDIAGLTHVRDLFPTLLELVGIAPPRGAAFEGISLAPAPRSESWHPPDRTLIVQYPSEPGGKGQAAVLWRRWRLVHDRELYDLGADPAQANDVAVSHPDIVVRLRGIYEEWWSRIEPGLQINWPSKN
jgi:arylsulfatase A-like enzyme